MRHFVTALLLLGAGCAGLDRARTDGLDRQFTEVTLPGDPGALVVQYNPGFAPANILVVRMPDGTLVLCSSPYDTVATRAMVRGLRQRFRPPRIVAINAHFHPDGTGGNEGYALEGVETYGSDLTAAALARRGSEVWQETARAAPPPARARLEATPRVAATRTFRAADGLRLSFGGESVQVIYPGAGHSPDNVVVYFPSRRLLFGGDLIRAARAGVGYRGDANLVLWRAAVRSLTTLPFDEVVPGHGESGGHELLDHTLKVVTNAVSPEP
jgi:metallo-beta-lactamase class B